MSFDHSPLHSMTCSVDWKIPLLAFLNSPPISLTNYAPQLEICSVKRRSRSSASAVRTNIAQWSNRPLLNANASPESSIIFFSSRAPNPPNNSSPVRPLTQPLPLKKLSASTRQWLKIDISKSIVDLHGGSATIQGQVNRGTTVILTFPKQTSSDLRA